jgi:hypothetical protein
MHVGVTHLTGSHGVVGNTGTARSAVPTNTLFVCGGCLGTLPVENVASRVKPVSERTRLFFSTLVQCPAPSRANSFFGMNFKSSIGKIYAQYASPRRPSIHD